MIVEAETRRPGAPVRAFHSTLEKGHEFEIGPLGGVDCEDVI